MKTDDEKKSDTCDLVLFGDYMLPGPDWTGEIPLTPIAVSPADPNHDAPTVRVFTMGDVSGSKYWEVPGSEGHAEKIYEESWLPQIVANELHERIINEGRDSVPRGEFIEEACNEGGESVLVVDAALLKRRHKAFYSMLLAKRIVGKLMLSKFFFYFVRPASTKAVALKFIEQGTSLDEALDTTSVPYSSLRDTHLLVETTSPAHAF